MRDDVALIGYDVGRCGQPYHEARSDLLRAVRGRRRQGRADRAGQGRKNEDVTYVRTAALSSPSNMERQAQEFKMLNFEKCALKKLCD